MFTIFGVRASWFGPQLTGVSVETRGPCIARQIGYNSYEIDGLPDGLFRVAAPGHIPQIWPVLTGNVGDEIRLRPTSVLPPPIRGGYRLLWTELNRRFLPDWDNVGLMRWEVPPSLFSPITMFDLTTRPGIWWKAVKVFNSAGRQLQDLQSEEGRYAGGTTRLFTMSDLMGGTLVLSKAKFLGFHTDMYEVGLDAFSLPVIMSNLWTFNWVEQ